MNKTTINKPIGIILAMVTIAICISLLAKPPQETISAETKAMATHAIAASNTAPIPINENIVTYKMPAEVTEQKTEPETVIADDPPITNCFAGTGYFPAEYEMWMMCTVVSSEAGYCDDMIQKAVAHTIINRILSDEFPNSIYGVLTQENQYTAVQAYFDGNYKDGLYPGSEAWDHTMQLCYDVMYEYDFTNGAQAYYNPSVCGYNDWFESLTLVYTDEYQRYFRI